MFVELTATIDILFIFSRMYKTLFESLDLEGQEREDFEEGDDDKKKEIFIECFCRE
jgi:hypothetical protein